MLMMQLLRRVMRRTTGMEMRGMRMKEMRGVRVKETRVVIEQ